MVRGGKLVKERDPRASDEHPTPDCAELCYNCQAASRRYERSLEASIFFLFRRWEHLRHSLASRFLLLMCRPHSSQFLWYLMIRLVNLVARFLNVLDGIVWELRVVDLWLDAFLTFRAERQTAFIKSPSTHSISRQRWPPQIRC
jgi:hypothetical protein